jgi:hypothetical protein
MLAIISTLFSWLACRFRSRVELELEVIALRHQLALLMFGMKTYAEGSHRGNGGRKFLEPRSLRFQWKALESRI